MAANEHPAPEAATRVAVVGPDTLVAAGIECLLASVDEFDAVAAGENSAEAARVLRAAPAPIVLFYASTPCTGGAELIAELASLGLAPAYFAIVEPEDRETARACIDAGAAAVVTTASKRSGLLAGLRACRDGRLYLAAGVRQLARTPSPLYESLTRREREILSEIGDGYSNRRIAERLGITYKTVDAHRQNIARKLDAHGIAELVKHAIRAGLATLES